MNQRGTSAIEIVPILAVFVLILNFSLGFFGVIHSGILNSIAARNYAFETFRNRANLNYLRDREQNEAAASTGYYNLSGIRYHVVIREGAGDSRSFLATRRPIKFTERENVNDPLGTSSEHNSQVAQVQEGRKVSNIFGSERSGVDPVWIKSVYGICLNAKCIPYRQL
ncbi:MAG: hypothetical protein WCH11_03365 [Bdellovibrio sp.]